MFQPRRGGNSSRSGSVHLNRLFSGMDTWIFAATYNYRYYGGPYSPRYEDLLAGGGGILAFVYGLAAGIFSLKRKMFAHCLTGGAVTVAEGFLLVLAFAQQ